MKGFLCSRKAGVLMLFVWLVLVVCLLVFSSGCIQRPKVTSGSNNSASSFNHQGITTNCASCHDAGKSFDAFQFSSFSSTVFVNQMLHSYNGGSTAGLPADCSACHYTKAQAGGFKSWNIETVANTSNAILPTLGTFHSNVTATTCTVCHSGLTPMPNINGYPATFPIADLNGVANAVPNHTGYGDCLGCHSGGIGLNWTVASATGHTATQTNCNSCHSAGNTTDPNNAFNALNNVLTYQMLHTQINTTSTDCYICHRATAISSNFTSWQVETVANTSNATRTTLGAFHINYTPTTCVSCHSTVEPIPGQNGYPSNGFPIADINGTAGAVPDHTGYADCSSCHTSVGLNWTVASSTGHTATQTNCTSCHGLGSTADPNNKYPGIYNVITNQMLHTFSGLPDCYLCHRATALSENPAFSSWQVETAANTSSAIRTSLGIFHTNFTPSTCASCHSTVEPIPGQNGYPSNGFPIADINGTAGAVPDHTGYADCSTCHTSVGLDWTKASAGAPTNITVGGFTIPQPPATSSGTTESTVSIPHPTVGSTSCTACHSTSSYTPAIGYDHASFGSSTCMSCHEYGSTLVGTPWPSTQKGSGSGDTRPVPMTTVNECGGVPNAAMAGGAHWYSMTDPSTNKVVDCNACHSTPSGIVKSGSSGWGFKHPNKSSGSTSSTPMCAACHQKGGC